MTVVGPAGPARRGRAPGPRGCPGGRRWPWPAAGRRGTSPPRAAGTSPRGPARVTGAANTLLAGKGRSRPDRGRGGGAGRPGAWSGRRCRAPSTRRPCWPRCSAERRRAGLAGSVVHPDPVAGVHRRDGRPGHVVVAERVDDRQAGRLGDDPRPQRQRVGQPGDRSPGSPTPRSRTWPARPRSRSRRRWPPRRRPTPTTRSPAGRAGRPRGSVRAISPRVRRSGPWGRAARRPGRR